uniref:Ig-like domain-containing protein n=1 Tax=Falco tinnunculus TaxID=100819 RepID=A0A8C4TWI7_FALTI
PGLGLCRAREGQLVEAGGGLRPSGGSVQLSCRTFGLPFSFRHAYWYRQAFGGVLEWVSTISHDSSVTKFGPGVKGRAAVSRDNSQSVLYLALRALRPQDSARYFCSIDTVAGNPAEP